MIGRTLLQQAVPVTFGLVAAGWLTALDEARAGLTRVTARLAVQFGGAAGTLASLGADGPRVAALMAEELGLAVPLLPWHTDRLRILDISTSLARAAAVLGKIARDVTLLAQNEIGELREGPAPEGKGPEGKGPEVPRPEGQRPETRPPGSGGHGAEGYGGTVSPVRRGGVGGIVPPGIIRGGSSAMPNKRNPVAAVAVLGCTRQVPGLLATLVASAEQEHQRAAGAWHAEWEPYTALLRLTQSAAAWGAELLRGLVVDVPRMAANLAATEGLPLAEHVTALLSGVLGAARAHDLVAQASERAVGAGLPLRDVLLGVPELADALTAAGISAEQVEAALEPAGYLGATQVFIDAALAAHGGEHG
jgi:3-carboxy-cis,cis-muconate cycloisomerase